MYCSVCNIPCKMLNYGVNCCPACAAFYRRTVDLQLAYTCRFQGNCDISSKNRYSCRKCRLDKCLAIGMNKCEKINGKYSVKQDSHQNRNFAKELHDIFLRARPQQCLPSSYCQQALDAYREYLKKWPERRKDNLQFIQGGDLNQAAAHQYYAITRMTEFFVSLTPFSNLPLDQMRCVFRNTWKGFLELDAVFTTACLLGWHLNERRLVLFDGTVMDFEQKVDHKGIADCDASTFATIWMDTYEYRNRFYKEFFIARPDEMEVVYLMMRAMWSLENVDGISKTTKNIAREVQFALSEDLHNYYIYEKAIIDYAKRLYKLENICVSLMNYVEKTKNDGKTSLLFNILKFDAFLDHLR